MAPRTRQSQTAPARLHLNIPAKLKSEQGRQFGAVCVALDPDTQPFLSFCALSSTHGCACPCYVESFKDHPLPPLTPEA